MPLFRIFNLALYVLFLPENETISALYKTISSILKLLVISDGDFIRNQRNLIRSDIPRGAPLPLGFDQFTQQQFGNSDFIQNAIDYMLNSKGLIYVRGREVTLRLLDSQKIEKNKNLIIGTNLIAPAGVILIFGIIFRILRKKGLLNSQNETH